jgi:hypothetical protein
MWRPLKMTTLDVDDSVHSYDIETIAWRRDCPMRSEHTCTIIGRMETYRSGWPVVFVALLTMDGEVWYAYDSKDIVIAKGC